MWQVGDTPMGCWSCLRLFTGYGGAGAVLEGHQSQPGLPTKCGGVGANLQGFLSGGQLGRGGPTGEQWGCRSSALGVDGASQNQHPPVCSQPGRRRARKCHLLALSSPEKLP